MNHYLLIAIGGSLGAILRYSLDSQLYKFYISDYSTPEITSSFNAGFGTLFVNILGSFILGFLYFYLQNSNYKLFLITGFLGSLTTFSTFILYSHLIINNEKPILFLVYINANLIGAYFAFLIGKKLLGLFT